MNSLAMFVGYAVLGWVAFVTLIKTAQVSWCLFLACWLSWSAISGAYKAGKGKEIEWSSLPKFIYQSAECFYGDGWIRLNGFEWSFYGREAIND